MDYRQRRTRHAQYGSRRRHSRLNAKNQCARGLVNCCHCTFNVSHKLSVICHLSGDIYSNIILKLPILEMTPSRIVTSHSLAQMDRSGLPFETSGLWVIREKAIGGWCEGAILRISTLWLIAKMCHFPLSGLVEKLSRERSLRF